jgi:uncharacterized protein (TIGR02996 family)
MPVPNQTEVERQALLNAILAEPDDDNVRLVYADWLDEHGEQERAEFIRVQIEIKPYKKGELAPGCCLTCPDPERHDYLRERERELLTYKFVEPTTGHFCGGGANSLFFWFDGSGKTVEFHFRRGFIESLTLSSTDWFAHHAEILASHPVRTVRLTTSPQALWERGVVWFEAMGRDCNIIQDYEYVSMPRYISLKLQLLQLWWPKIEFHIPEQQGQLLPPMPGVAGEPIWSGSFVRRGDDGLIYNSHLNPENP